MLKSTEELIDGRLNQAMILHQSGELARAQGMYEEILAIQPDNAEALHLLGIIDYQTQNHQRAVDLIDQAIALYPDNAAYYSNRGLALYGLNKLTEAITSYDQALERNPDYAEAWYNRGLALQGLTQLDAAIVSYDRAIEHKPDYAEAWLSRGNALQELKQYDAAVASYEKAIGIRPYDAVACYNRSVTLHEFKQYAAALAGYDRVLSLEPDHAEAWSNRGVALQELKQYESAVASYDQAIGIKPDYAEAFYNRAMALQELKHLEAAVASYDQAIALKPEYAEAWSSRGVALQELDQREAAMASFDQATALDSGHVNAYYNKSLALLSVGDYRKGWELHEWRWKRDDFPSPRRNFTQPLWLGDASIAGKTILLHSEQGLGDTIQFCRYVKLVVDLGARVILEVEQPLIGLLKQLESVAEFVVRGEVLPWFDFHCPLMSLPLAFKTTIETIPSASKYLSGESERVAEWSRRLGRKTKPRIGLVWSGNKWNTNLLYRSFPLSELIPWLSPEFQYVSLQQEVWEADKSTFQAHARILHYGDELNDFIDTAALCELMDMIITIDTSVAHLSGAMGKPTCLMLPFFSDWRWLLDRNDSPWYDSVRLYRQEARGDWQGVFSRINADILNNSC